MLGTGSTPGRVLALVATVWLTTGAVPARAQSTAQLPLQFDFLPPGARSTGMGAAFVAVADDATAAFTNPAGLGRRTRREISGELRVRSLETRFLTGGRISGAVTGIGLDTVPGAVYGQDLDRQYGPSFASVLWPVLGATLTGYAHRVAAIENAFFNQGVFERIMSNGLPEDRNRENPIGGDRRIAINAYGLSVGHRGFRNLSIGAGVALYSFSARGDFARYGIDGNFAGPVNRGRMDATATQRGDDWSPGFNVGALYDIQPRLTAGMAFRRGPAFTFSQRDRIPSLAYDNTRIGRFKVPDVLSAGLDWRPLDSLRVALDVNRVRHSQLVADFITFQALASSRPGQLRLDDGSELHAGAEFLPSGAPMQLALRAGFWHDPDHVVRYEPTPAQDEVDTLYRATLPGGDAQSHVTFGAGLAPSRRIELNVAADLSGRTTHVTFSTIFRFD